MPPRHSQYNRDFAVPQEMRSLITIFSVPTIPIKERLLAHFKAYSPLWLTIGGDVRRSTLLSLVMPVVERSPLVLDCVLALSAADLSKYESTSSELASLANSFYGQALSGVRSALDRESTLTDSAESLPCAEDDTLMAVLLLCAHEAVNFTATYKILPHINAAAAICYKRSRSTAANSRLRGLLFEFSCYFFALTAFSHGHALQLHLGPDIFDSPFLAANETQGILLGEQCRMVLSCVLKIATLTSDLNASSAVAQDHRMTALKLIASQLGSWSGIPLPDDGKTPITPDSAVTELYRLACLIHVKKILHLDLHGLSDIQRLLSQFISVLHRLPADSPANGILCWPLVVAGMASVDVTHRRLIVGRLRTLHETWRSGILTQSATLLDNFWKEDKNSDRLHKSPTMHSIHVKSVMDLHCDHNGVNYPIVLL
ncbi:hypothetical protein E8E14_005156 [Neopestalotiopsis sp. 37M]|nr:hypothetical protein E8E14_005156 [Neopestalotiopsis sp. 37M]